MSRAAGISCCSAADSVAPTPRLIPRWTARTKKHTLACAALLNCQSSPTRLSFISCRTNDFRANIFNLSGIQDGSR